MKYKFNKDEGKWQKYTKIRNNVEDDAEPCYEWRDCSICNVPVGVLCDEWGELIIELSDKECELSNKKEEYNQKEFEIVYVSDIDFKGMYGSTAEKVRKQHAAKELKHLGEEIKSLELSINWIKHYIPLIKGVVMCNRNNMPPISVPAPVILSGDSVDPKTIKKSVEKAVKECKW